MSSSGQNFSMFQGVHRILTVRVTGTAPSSATAIKWVLADLAGAAVVTKTLAGGGVVNATESSFDVLLYPSDTEEVEPGEYVHEARVSDADSQEDVVLTGVVVMRASVTR